MKREDLLLESASGFMMPFAAGDDEQVQVTLGFGEQVHPSTGEKFNHRGMDLAAYHVPLFALASGIVVGVGTDSVHDNYIIIKYGPYEVKYGHVSEAYVSYGQPVTAGQQVAQSGDFLHFEVSTEGKLLDPSEFLGAVYANVMLLDSLGMKGKYRVVNLGVKVHTDYDADEEEVMQLLFRFFPSYMNDLRSGAYALPPRTEQSLRNVFAQSARKNYFYETLPDLGNPLGLTGRAAPLVSKIQNLLVGDFLNYMALRHDTYLSSWGDSQKKKFLSRQQPTVL